MQLADIKTYVKNLAEQDLSIQDADILRWINSAIDRINVALQADIPKITTQPDTYEPEFDSRFHESLILFANAKYRESDADFNSAGYFMNEFNSMLITMQRDMNIKPSQRKDRDVQQIVVTNASTLVYNLTMPYGSYFDLIQVYKNDVLVDPINYRLTLNTKQITFQGITLAVNDKITVVFENNSDLNNPPYEWWTGW